MLTTASLLQRAAAHFPTPYLLLSLVTRAFPAHEPSPGSARPAAKPAGVSLPASRASHHPHMQPLA